VGMVGDLGAQCECAPKEFEVILAWIVAAQPFGGLL
jgi:hypothetical protein